MSLFLPIAIVLIAVALYLTTRTTAQKGVHRTFKLEPGRYKLIGSDLGGESKSIMLTHSGIGGVPDAIFEDRKKPRIIVGEYKARLMKRGPRPREYYQVILYIGIAKLRWPQHEVVGLISYRDKTVWIYHDQRAFQGLVDLKPEAVRSIRAMKAANPTPLHKRIPIKIPVR